MSPALIIIIINELFKGVDTHVASINQIIVNEDE